MTLRSPFLRHTLFALGGAGAGGALAAPIDLADLIHFISLASAYAALMYLAATLLVGPLNILRTKRRPAISIRLRRHLGVWTAIFTLIHVGFGINVHLAGDYLRYFFEPEGGAAGMRLRSDPFGIANDLGALTALVVTALFALSNNASVRALGAGRWKAVQRSVYVGAIGILVHALMYQAIERRDTSFIVAVTMIAVLVTVSQVWGLSRYRRANRSTLSA